MFCIKCGAKNPDGSKFCSSCGSPMIEIPKNTPKPVETTSSQTTSVTSAPLPVPPQAAAPTQSTQTASPPQPPQSTVPTVYNTPQSLVQNPSPSPAARNANVSFGSDPKRRHCPKCNSERIISKTNTSTTTKTSGYKGSLGCLGWLLWGPLGLLCGLCGMGSKTTVKNSNCLVCQDCGKEFLSIQDKLNTLKVGEIQCFVIGIVLIILSFLGFGSGDVLISLIVMAIGILFVIGGVFVIKDIHEVELKGYDASCYKEDK